MAVAFERWVIQRKQRDGSYLDWPDPMTGTVEHELYDTPRRILLRRYALKITDYRIIRRTWTPSDEPVHLV